MASPMATEARYMQRKSKRDIEFVAVLYPRGRVMTTYVGTSVFSARDNDGHDLAIKYAPENLCALLSNERKMLARLQLMDDGLFQHRNIVALKGTEEDNLKNKQYLFLELCENDLCHILPAGVGLGESHRCVGLFAQLIRAVWFCHQRDVFHGDLKPENVLLKREPVDCRNAYAKWCAADDEAWRTGFNHGPPWQSLPCPTNKLLVHVVKLCDFGTSTCQRYTSQTSGTPEYAAPEKYALMSNAHRDEVKEGSEQLLGLLFPEARRQADELASARLASMADESTFTPTGSRMNLYGEKYDAAKADVWSLGIVLYTMLTGDMPWKYASLDNETFARWWRHGVLSLPPEQRLSQEAMELLTQMLCVDPARRVTLEDVLRSRFIHRVPKIERRRRKVRAPPVGEGDGRGRPGGAAGRRDRRKAREAAREKASSSAFLVREASAQAHTLLVQDLQGLNAGLVVDGEGPIPVAAVTSPPPRLRLGGPHYAYDPTGVAAQTQPTRTAPTGLSLHQAAAAPPSTTGMGLSLSLGHGAPTAEAEVPSSTLDLKRKEVMLRTLSGTRSLTDGQTGGMTSSIASVVTMSPAPTISLAAAVRPAAAAPAVPRRMLQMLGSRARPAARPVVGVDTVLPAPVVARSLPRQASYHTLAMIEPDSPVAVPHHVREAVPEPEALTDDALVSVLDLEVHKMHLDSGWLSDVDIQTVAPRPKKKVMDRHAISGMRGFAGLAGVRATGSSGTGREGDTPRSQYRGRPVQGKVTHADEEKAWDGASEGSLSGYSDETGEIVYAEEHGRGLYIRDRRKSLEPPDAKILPYRRAHGQAAHAVPLPSTGGRVKLRPRAHVTPQTSPATGKEKGTPDVEGVDGEEEEDSESEYTDEEEGTEVDADGATFTYDSGASDMSDGALSLDGGSGWEWDTEEEGGQLEHGGGIDGLVAHAHNLSISAPGNSSFSRPFSSVLRLEASSMLDLAGGKLGVDIESTPTTCSGIDTVQVPRDVSLDVQDETVPLRDILSTGPLGRACFADVVSGRIGVVHVRTPGNGSSPSPHLPSSGSCRRERGSEASSASISSDLGERVEHAFSLGTGTRSNRGRLSTSPAEGPSSGSPRRAASLAGSTAGGGGSGGRRVVNMHSLMRERTGAARSGADCSDASPLSAGPTPPQQLSRVDSQAQLSPVVAVLHGQGWAGGRASPARPASSGSGIGTAEVQQLLSYVELNETKPNPPQEKRT